LLALCGRPREAIALLEAAIGLGDGEALEQLVDMADDLGRGREFDEALAAYDKALEAEPNHRRAEANRALTRARAGRSLDGYEALVKRHPGRADLLNDAGLAAWGWGRLDEARRLIETAAELPGSTDAHENLAALLLTVEPHDPARARTLLKSVLEEEPTRSRALFLWHYSSAIKSR
jgi:tetratricopeptide (TPR) repeat protein